MPPDAYAQRAQIPLLIDIDSFNFIRIALKIGSTVTLLPVMYAWYIFSWCHSWVPVLTMKFYVLPTICKKQHATRGFYLNLTLLQAEVLTFMACKFKVESVSCWQTRKIVLSAFV